MTNALRYLEDKARERPSYPAGTRRAVQERDTQLGFQHPACFFCKATVLPDEFAIHHEVPWSVIKEWLINDYDFQIADPEMQRQAIDYVYGYPDNLHSAHRTCNAADGYKWREREAAKRWERMKKDLGELGF